MGFVGNLGDLSLDNILQVVSLSSQTGLLALRNEEVRGEIAFRLGKVVGARIESPDEDPCHWLVRRGVIDQERLGRALDISGSADAPAAIADILQQRFAVERELVCRAGRKEIEKILTDLLRWDSGTFSFETCREEELSHHFRFPGALLLEEGILPLFSLNADSESSPVSARCQDAPSVTHEVSDHISGNDLLDPPTDPEQIPDSEGPRAMSAHEVESTGEVFLVDDDPLVREKLAGDLSERGWEVTSFSGGSDLLMALDRAVDGGRCPTVLIDLIMPRFNGEGILGGLELLQVVRSRYTHLPIGMFSDYFCTETEKLIQNLGVAQLVVKPHRRSFEGEGSEVLDGFAKRIIKILPTRGNKEVFAEIEEPEAENGASLSPGSRIVNDEGEDPNRRQLVLLKTLSAELCDQDIEEQSRLLVLRFAAELFDRAIIFSITGDMIQATGQFGFDNLAGIQGKRLGEIAVPLREPSIFSSVLENRSTVKRRLGSGDWERCLAGFLDGPVAAEIFLGPVLCQGRVVSILYGDTLPGGEPFGETAGLEVFLSLVGLLKERSLLKAALDSPSSLCLNC